MQQDPVVGPTRSALRKSAACNECKRRKVRCSGDQNCANCLRDGKQCRYSSPLQKFALLQRRLQHAEHSIDLMKKAWDVHLPDINIEDAIKEIISRDLGQEGANASARHEYSIVGPGAPIPDLATTSRTLAEQEPDSSPAESSNAEDFEFDEAQDFDNATDGMGFLVIEPQKSGYMGPQSGVAALKFLQTLHLNVPSNNTSADRFALDEPSPPNLPPTSPADIDRYLQSYFAIYHTAYPILHEGIFRAHVSGALAKPRDGSWPLLYNTVLAIGAFVGETHETNADVPFYKAARKHCSIDILEKGSLSYVQGIVLLANYLQKRNKPNFGFALIGVGWSMALAIGLHREFDLPSSSPFTMEIRRRAWWTLFTFVSGAQLTLGRPPASLIGINVRLPRELNDQDLAVDIDELPVSKMAPTVTSCIVYQVKLAKIANVVQAGLLNNQTLREDRAMSLDREIATWRQGLPPSFDEQTVLEDRFEIPKRILIWRSYHLRIVLHRNILFKAITEKHKISPLSGPINACLTAAEECVLSICRFLESRSEHCRGLAWYATYWLITASFVQATCFLYDPTHDLASEWKNHLDRAIGCLSDLGSVLTMSLRARDILKKLLDQSQSTPLADPSSLSAFETLQYAGADFWQPANPSQFHAAQGQLDVTYYERDGMQFPWYTGGSSDVELLDATSGMIT